MTENIQLTDQDVSDLKAMGVDPEQDAPAERTLLVIWDHVLKSGADTAAQPIPMMVSAKVVATWPKLSYQDTAVYHRLYHEYLGYLQESLVEAIRKHPEALSFVGLEDAEENREIYIDLLVTWNLQLDAIEREWAAEQEDSHIVVAAVVDVRHFIFSDMGLAGHLSAIGFQLRDEEFIERLNKAKAEQEEQ